VAKGQEKKDTYVHVRVCIYIGIEMGMFETWGACSHPFDAQDNERGKY